jgi:hypothetical protein
MSSLAGYPLIALTVTDSGRADSPIWLAALCVSSSAAFSMFSC